MQAVTTIGRRPGARLGSCASAGKTIPQDGVPKCCRDLLFLA
jgi:hypothetical protein